MPLHRAQTTFVAASELPEDAITNTMHFQLEGTILPDDYNNILDLVEDFYTLPAEVEPVYSLFSAQAMTGDATTRIYNLEEPEPRVPIAERQWDFTPPSTEVYPHEVALVLSFQAAQESGIPQARRRNRIYLGPLNESVGNAGRPSAAFRQIVANAASQLLAASTAAINTTWMAYSPTTASAQGIPNARWPVVGGWVDDAFDTQRRRGVAPTSRLVWPSS